MSGNGKTPAGHDTSSLGDKVARELFELVEELGANRKQQMTVETRILGLARVLQGKRAAFGPEHAEQVSDVIKSQGDLDHARGSKSYARAERVRALGKAR